MESARGEKRGRAHDHVITQDFKIHKSRWRRTLSTLAEGRREYCKRQDKERQDKVQERLLRVVEGVGVILLW